MIIGGAEDKLRKRTILKEFVVASGGRDARIVVIPTASSLGPEIVEVYEALFTKLGAGEVRAARPESREDAHDPDLVAAIDGATGIFMTGGNQLKLSSFIIGTPFADAIHAAYARGAAVGGTSAGASIVADHMIAFGSGGSTPKQRMSQLSVGLGLLRGAVVDQHFEQRNRYGRLLSLVAQSPSLLGIGVDEDTAAVVSTDDEGRQVLEVVGRGAVTVLDGRHMVTDAHAAREHRPILASGVVMHALPAGSRFDLDQRALVPAPAVTDASEADELAVANRDLSKLARDIAADDASPSVLRRRVARRSRGARP